MFSVVLVSACASVGDPVPVLVTPSASAAVGPLFADGLTDAHGCTASVVNSPQGDLILTAAHCVTGTGAGLTFAPDYDSGRTPDGVWSVVHTYADAAWVSGQDPADDEAILQVADRLRAGRPVTVQSVAGGDDLGSAPAAGERVTVIAYNVGLNDQARRCTTVVRYERGYPTFDCAGFRSGSSGAPWLTRSTSTGRYVVHAVIGGLSYGGCAASTSYSSAFGSAVQALLARAEASTAPDTMPRPGGDGC